MSLFDSLVSREPIHRGWSADRKYRAEDDRGNVWFLRISPENRYAQRQLQFSHMQKVFALGVRVCEPVEFGRCDEGCYMLLGWIEGRDAEALLPELTGEARYRYGLEAGRMLKTIHSLPAPMETESWAVRYGRKTDFKIAGYEACPLKYEKGQLFLDLIARERHLFRDRPTVWHHGDYHCGNLMFDEQMRLTVIDFDREDVGDPWYEFNRLIWDVRVGAEFARGMVDGYFDGEVPEEFWRLQRLYQCQNMISSLPWAVDFGQKELQVAIENAAQVLQWYDDLKKVVPNWYTT